MTRAEFVAWLERTLPADGVIDSIEIGIAAQVASPGQLVAEQGVNDDLPAAWGIRQRMFLQTETREELLDQLGPVAPVAEELLRRMHRARAGEHGAGEARLDFPAFPANRVLREGDQPCEICGSGPGDHGTRDHEYKRPRWGV